VATTRVVLGAGPRNKEVPLDFGGCGLADFGNLLKVAKIGCPLLKQARKKTRSFIRTEKLSDLQQWIFLLSRWVRALNS
jgi:hypothetical protein